MPSSTIRDQIIKTVTELESIPTLPVIVERLKKEIEDPDADASSVAKLIEEDPPTTARVLRLVNSPIYAPVQSEAITLDQAVVRLGMTTLKDLVITSSMMTLFPKSGATTFDRREFWRHSISCGLVAAAITDFMDNKESINRSEVELAGLCHDIGKVIMDEFFHDEFVDILEAAEQEHLLLYEAELKYWQIDHGEIGGILAERWGMPDSIKDAIAYHHRPTKAAGKETEKVVQLIHLADFICNHQALGISGNGRIMAFPRECFESLNLDFELIPDIIERVREESQNSEIFLSLDEV